MEQIHDPGMCDVYTDVDPYVSRSMSNQCESQAASLNNRRARMVCGPLIIKASYIF